MPDRCSRYAATQISPKSYMNPDSTSTLKIRNITPYLKTQLILLCCLLMIVMVVCLSPIMKTFLLYMKDKAKAEELTGRWLLAVVAVNLIRNRSCCTAGKQCPTVASRSLQVDAVSLMMAVGIYLRLGFSSGHAYAYKVPVTFGLTLCCLLALLGVVLCVQDR